MKTANHWKTFSSTPLQISEIMETTQQKKFSHSILELEGRLQFAWAGFKSAIGLGTTNSAVQNLSRTVAQAKLSKTIERIRSPRRMALTIASVVLGMVWLGQAVSGIMFRSAASSQRLMEWIPLSLGLYMVWNFLKSAGQQPVEPFEWTETERELLHGAPLSRRDIIQYRSHAIARSALTKSLIFTFVMIPDLQILPMGFVGIFLGLAFVEILRVMTEIFVYGLRRRELLIFRIAIFGIATVVAARALTITLMTTSWIADHTASLSFLLNLMTQFSDQAATWYGDILLAPFRWIAEVIVCQSLNPLVLAKLTVAFSVVIGLAKSVLWLDEYSLNRKLAIDRRNFVELKRVSAKPDPAFATTPDIAAPRHLFGAGSLIWRQLQGAWSFRYSLLVSLLIPAILSCMPSFTGVTGFALVANTVGALCFYSMVLLPASLKFDFRRDVDRITVLKSLPISPFWVAVGQLAVPILLSIGFQLFTLLLVMVISPYNPLFILGAMLILVPMNFFIFSFENAAFLWYPYRLNQEGMQVLMRSILVFTAKTLIFALGFATTFVWVVMAKWICITFLADVHGLHIPHVFAGGMFLMITATSLIAFCSVVKAFSRFDPSADLAGLD